MAAELIYHYDLILLDLNMQIMNGFDACQQIKQHYELLNRGRVIQSQFKHRKPQQNPNMGHQ